MNWWPPRLPKWWTGGSRRTVWRPPSALTESLDSLPALMMSALGERRAVLSAANLLLQLSDMCCCIMWLVVWTERQARGAMCSGEWELCRRLSPMPHSRMEQISSQKRYFMLCFIADEGSIYDLRFLFLNKNKYSPHSLSTHTINWYIVTMKWIFSLSSSWWVLFQNPVPISYNHRSPSIKNGFQNCEKCPVRNP